MSIPIAAPDFICQGRQTPYVVTGETLDKRTAALAAWSGCACGEGSS